MIEQADPRAELGAALSALQDAAAKWDVRATIDAKTRAFAVLDGVVATAVPALDPELLARIQAAYDSAVRMRFISVKLDLADVEQLLGVGVHAR